MRHGRNNLIDLPLGAATSEDATRTVEEGGPRDRHASASPQEDNEPRSFEAFVRAQYSGLVRFLTRRIGTVQDAEDLAQESFARLLRYRNDGTQVGSWRPLLYRIAVNASHDQARRSAPYKGGGHVDVETQDIPDDAPTPEDQTHRAQQRERLREAIMALPPRCRQVWLLRNAHGMRRGQIAHHCGISLKMVDKHLAKALHKLQQQVAFDDGETL